MFVIFDFYLTELEIDHCYASNQLPHRGMILAWGEGLGWGNELKKILNNLECFIFNSMCTDKLLLISWGRIATLSQSYCFSSSHVGMWELDYKESWVPKNWCFWTVMLEKTLESPLDCKEIQPLHLKRNQSWIFIGRTDAGAETPILWPPYVKNWLIGKDPDAGRDWG